MAPPQTPDEDAASGTRVHAWLAGDRNVKLNSDETYRAERCLRLEERLLWSKSGTPTARLIRERRLWLLDPLDFSPLFSGQPDGLCLYEGGTEALVWDFKPGRIAVEPAERNWQMRALAVLVAENFHVEQVTVAIIQPLIGPLSVARYDAEDLATATEQCLDLARRIITEDRRVPTFAGCRFCPAKAICPEAVAVMSETATITLRESPAEVTTGETIAHLLERCRLAERVIAAIEERAKQMLADNPHSVPGWQLRPGQVRTKFTDMLGVWAKAEAAGIKAEDFTNACSLTKTDLKELLHDKLGLKGKALDQTVKEFAFGCSIETQNKPSLERIE